MHNEGIVKEIALEDIKLKIQASFFMLLNNAKTLKSNNCWNIPYNKDETLQGVEGKILNYVLNLDNLFGDDASVRDNQILDFAKTKKEVLEISESVYSYFYYNAQLRKITDNHLNLSVLEKHENINVNSTVLKKGYLDFISKNDDTEIDKISTAMSSIPLNMIDKKYNDYIKNSLETMLKNTNETSAKDTLRSLKLKFSANKVPNYGIYYKEMYNKLETISCLDIETLSYDELNEIYETLEDNAQIFTEIEDYLATIYESINYIIYILTFSHDINFIFEENLIYKDIFYACKDSLKNGTEELDEQLDESISNICESLVDRIIDMKESINQVLKNKSAKDLSKDTLEILQIREIITEMYYESLSDIIYTTTPDASAENSNVTKEFLESEINDFLNYISSSTKQMNDKDARLIKQSFLENLPCPFTNEEFKTYLNSALENSTIKEKAIMMGLLKI